MKCTTCNGRGCARCLYVGALPLTPPVLTCATCRRPWATCACCGERPCPLDVAVTRRAP